MSEVNGGEGGNTHEPGAGEPGSTGSTLDFIPEQYREASWATKYSTAEDFFKGVEGMSKLIGNKEIVEGIKLPGEDATEEDYSKFFNSIGRPETSEAYDLEKVQMPEGYNLEDTQREFRELAHKAGLSQKQASALYKGYMENQKNHFEKASQPVELDMGKITKEAFPEDTEKNFTLAKKGATSLGLADKLDEEGLSANPLVLKLCAEIGKLSSEDNFQDGKGSMDTPESINAKIKELQSNPDYMNSLDKQNQVYELFKQLNSLKG